MTHLVSYIVEYLHIFIVHHFLRLWFLVLLLVISGGWYLSSINRGKNRCASESDREKIWRRKESLQLIDWIAIIALALFVSFCILHMVHGEDFAYYDNDQLTDFSATGNAFRPPVWPEEGRFFPLGHQEFNIVLHFTRTAIGYQSFVAVQMLVLLVVLFVVLRDMSVSYRVVALAAVMTAPSFSIPFTGLIYPDRNVLFWLGILIFCLVGYEKNGARIYFVGSLVASQFILYYKETVVVFLTTYAVARLLLGIHLAWQEGQRSWRELARGNALVLAMLGVAAIYSVSFVVAVFGYSRFSYVNGLKLDMNTTILGYVETDWLLPVFVFAVVWRVCRVLGHRGQFDPVWDPLAWGALTYVASLIALRLFRDYYMAPVDLIAFLYLAYLLAPWIHQKPRWRTVVAIVALVCIMIHNAAYSALKIINRKTVIQLNHELADFLKVYRPRATATATELWFPYADGYRLMELSSYLHYRGLPLSGTKENSAGAGTPFLFEGVEKFPDELCVAYKRYRCVPVVRVPEDGLVVILPDDKVPAKDLAELRQSSTELFSREPWPVDSEKEMWLQALHALAWDYWGRREPQNLWQVHVFRKTPRQTDGICAIRPEFVWNAIALRSNYWLSPAPAFGTAATALSARLRQSRLAFASNLFFERSFFAKRSAKTTGVKKNLVPSPRMLRP
jgi:hypothetical protein